MGHSPCVYDFCQSGKKVFLPSFIYSRILLSCSFAAQTVLDDALEASIMLLKLSICSTTSVFLKLPSINKTTILAQKAFLIRNRGSNIYKSATLTAILFIRILSLQPLGEYANYTTCTVLPTIILCMPST